jgi:ornithine carbamoyltransferase
VGKVTVYVSTLGRLYGSDFLDLAELTAGDVIGILDLAGRIKAGEWRQTPLQGRAVAILLQKPSTRTRVSFHVGVERLGGSPITLQDHEVGLGTRETPADVAAVLDRYVDGIVARLFSHRDLETMAAAARCPLINALTDRSHPCQVMADLLTVREHLGRLDGSVSIAFVGDGNNVAGSLIEAAHLLGLRLAVVTPPGYAPADGHGDGVRVTGDLGAVANADIVYTDVWTSMGQEAEAEVRRREFAEYQVDEHLMNMAPSALFMHCLPAHRGEEVAAGVIDGPRSIVFDQAENRLWVQMALMAVLIGGVS